MHEEKERNEIEKSETKKKGKKEELKHIKNYGQIQK